jgi:hypothetical protein
MPLQNRVTPFSTIEAVPDRGLFMGNRGRLHDEHRHLVTTGWRSRAWLVCLLDFRGRHRTVMAPGRYTELFFLDEAVALAAGHRPCAECRRQAFRAFVMAWATTSGGPTRAAALDAALHRDRVARLRGQEGAAAPLATLPFGAFFVLPHRGGWPWVQLDDGAAAWSHAGYTDWARWPPSLEVDVLTPSATLAALRAGYRPLLHPSVEAVRGSNLGVHDDRGCR